MLDTNTHSIMLDMHDTTYMESHVCPGATILPGTTRDCTRLHVQTINIMDVTRVRHHHHHHHHHHARHLFDMMPAQPRVWVWVFPGSGKTINYWELGDVQHTTKLHISRGIDLAVVRRRPTSKF